MLYSISSLAQSASQGSDSPLQADLTASGPTDSLVGPRTAVPNFNRAVVDDVPTGAKASTAGMSSVSGTSTPARLPEGIFSRAEAINRTVTGNAFLPPESIGTDSIVVLSPTRTRGWWDVTAFTGTALNYDSNVTRTSNSGRAIGDFYSHDRAGMDFRLGTAQSPVAFQGGYQYSADFFDRHSGFNTFTHDVDFSARVGRSNVVLTPYVSGRFRSVSDSSARDSGRETFDYLSEGVRGETRFDPLLSHTYDFTHTSVTYHQRTLADFQIWELDQQLNYHPLASGSNSASRGFPADLTVFPWVDWVRTEPRDFSGVDEINGGLGFRVTLNPELALQARAGWGEVETNDPSVREGHFAGWRYETGADYRPLRWLNASLTYARVLSFTPTTVGRSVDRLDLLVEGPLQFTPQWSVTPGLRLSRVVSNDYQDHENSTDLEPFLQGSCKLSPKVAFFAKVQYGQTQDQRSDLQTSLRVFQETVGVTAAF